jgi:hypothetical protein
VGVREWPLIGREVELELIDRAHKARMSGVVLGDAGR